IGPMNTSLTKQVESFRSASSADRESEFSGLLSCIKQAIKQDRLDEAARALAAAVGPGLDFTSAQSLVRLRERLRGQVDLGNTRCRLAVLGSFTTDQIAQLIDLFLFSAGVSLDVYQAGYGTFRQEILDPD